MNFSIKNLFVISKRWWFSFLKPNWSWECFLENSLKILSLRPFKICKWEVIPINVHSPCCIIFNFSNVIIIISSESNLLNPSSSYGCFWKEKIQTSSEKTRYSSFSQIFAFSKIPNLFWIASSSEKNKSILERLLKNN